MVEVPQIHGPFPEFAHPVAGIGKIGIGDDGTHARKRERFRNINREDLRVGMRAAEHHPGEHAGQTDIGPVLSATGHLVDPVMADRTGADHLVFSGAGTVAAGGRQILLDCGHSGRSLEFRECVLGSESVCAELVL